MQSAGPHRQRTECGHQSSPRGCWKQKRPLTVRLTRQVDGTGRRSLATMSEPRSLSLAIDSGRLKICECSRWRARWAPQPHHGHCHRCRSCCRSTWIFAHFTFRAFPVLFFNGRTHTRSGKVTSGVIALCLPSDACDRVYANFRVHHFPWIWALGFWWKVRASFSISECTWPDD